MKPIKVGRRSPLRSMRVALKVKLSVLPISVIPTMVAMPRIRDVTRLGFGPYGG